MRLTRSLFALSCLLLPACESWLPDGTLRVVHKCPAADTITIKVDAQVVGTVAQGSTADFPTRPGEHTVLASSGNGFQWDPKSVRIVSAQVESLSAECTR